MYYTKASINTQVFCVWPFFGKKKTIAGAQNHSRKKKNFVGSGPKLIIGATIHLTDQYEGNSNIWSTSYTLRR